MSQLNDHTKPVPCSVDFEVVPMEYSDLPEVIQIEESSFLDPWSADIFVVEFMNERSRRFVAKISSGPNAGTVAGYIIYWNVVCDEFHLMSIAVDSRFRRCGIGKALMQRMIDDAKECNGRIVLEVRVSNIPAQTLYASFGFRPIGLRRNYYKEQNEDALLMELEFGRGENR